MELFKSQRPRTWEHVAGGNQRRQVEAIKRLIQNNELPAFLLLSGPFGTGKTTIAKLIAKAANCLNPPGPAEICDTCTNCDAIEADASSGYLLMSAANTSSVDNTRQIVEEVRLSHQLRHRIVIIDEFQDLSQTAQNSLLVPFDQEDLPATFIGCSSNERKIQGSLISRATHFRLQRLTDDELDAFARNVVESNRFTITPDQLKRLTEMADGSPRTLLSNIEQFVITGYDPELLPPDWADGFCQAISDPSPDALPNGMNIIDEIRRTDADGANIAGDITILLTDLLIRPGDLPDWYPQFVHTYKEEGVRQIALLASQLASDMANGRKRADVGLTELILRLMTVRHAV